MTDKAKAAFLKREGWKVGQDNRGVDWFFSNKAKAGARVFFQIDEAYRIASRRKSARETRRLKAAGWVHCGRGCWAHPIKNGLWYRTQAITTLKAQP